MKDMKILFVIVLAMAGLASIWWYGWFGPITKQFQQIKQYTTYR
jgi:hypothetical protein